MYKYFQKFWLLIFVLIIAHSQKMIASHAVGGDITYTCLGGNQYEITLNLYRDCASNVNFGNTTNIKIKSTSCGVNVNFTLQRISITEVSQVCPPQASLTRCNGGPLPGIQKYEYKGTYTFPQACNDWTVSYSVATRNSAITNLQNPGNQDLYIEAKLNNTNGICNNSPKFNNLPVPYICQGVPFNFNHATVEPDGDVLTFSMIQPKKSATQNINYVAGYSLANPIGNVGGFNFNTGNGQFSFTPSPGLNQQAIITILVEEYNSNGDFVGSVMRDIQVVVIPCAYSPEPPTVSGINGTGNFVFDVCWGSSFCFDIFSNDLSPSDLVTMTWNNGIPSGTMNISGSPHPTGTFCWSPTISDTGIHLFSITVEDNACPLIGMNSYTFQINVTDGVDPPISAGPDIQICEGESVVLNSNYGAGGIPTWTPSSTLSCSSCPNPTASPTNNTVYTLSVNYPTGCTRTDNVLVEILDKPSVSIFPQNPKICNGGSVNLIANTSVANITWENGQTGSSVVYTPLNSEYFSVSVTDNSGCSSTDSTFLNVNQPPSTPFCTNYYVTTNGTGSGLDQNDPTNLWNALLVTQCSYATIKMAIGDYIIDSAITGIIGAVNLEGGYDPLNNWTKTSLAGATRILRTSNNVQGPSDAPRLSAFELNNASYFRFQDLTIEVQDAPININDSFGTSLYGVHLNGCSNYDFVRCQIITGNATDGKSGVDGQSGVNGENGLQGEASNCSNSNCIFGGTGPAAAGIGGLGGGGTAVGTAGINRNGGGGGNGGAGSGSCANNATDGESGGGSSILPFNTTAGVAGTQGNPGTNGEAGGNGTNGPSGANGITIPGQHNVGFYFPGKGTDGEDGAGGSGGAGGGGGGRNNSTNRQGNAGSGGGGGGQGGEKGTGGYGGGGNFGIYLFNNGTNSNFTDCNVTVGVAGAGGTGGVGGNGGLGGTGAGTRTDCAASVGNGGAGGNGGNGGRGGDGADATNGVSQNIYVDGTAPNSQILNFNLASQPVIEVENRSCTNVDIDFTSSISSNWNFGTSSASPIQTGTNVSTQFTNIGWQNISFSGNQYSGFLNISFSSSVLPEIITNATNYSQDTIVVCKGSSVDFWTLVVANDYEWDFNNAVTPSTYSTDVVNNVTFSSVGIYKITLRAFTDCCGWSPYDSITVIVDETPQVTVTNNNPYCQGLSTNVSLNTSSDSVVWTPNQYLNTYLGNDVICSSPNTITYAVNLFSNYRLCNYDTNIQVVVNLPPDLSNTSSVGTICINDGQASVNPTGGSGNYSYSWDDGQTTQTAVNLFSGNYQVTVIDNVSGCQSNTTIFVPNTNAPFVYIYNSIDVSCYGGNNGEANAIVTGGTAPFTYTWEDIANNVLLTGVGSDMISNLSAGEYSVSITDANNCSSSYDFFIGEPDTALYIMIIDTIPASCPGFMDGLIEVQADGGSGSYTYLWNDVFASTTPLINDLDTGTYTVTVTDLNNCTASITFNYPGFGPFITANAGINDTVCGQSIMLNATLTGTNGEWVYQGSNLISFTPNEFDPNAIISSNAYGVHELLWVEDNGFGCTDTDTIYISFLQDPIANTGNYPSILCDNELNLNAIPSVGNGFWSLVNGPGTVSFSPDSSVYNAIAQFSDYGQYTLQWEEHNMMCSSSDQFTITTSTFTANAGINDTICGNTTTLAAVQNGLNGKWLTGSGYTFLPDANASNAQVFVSSFNTYNFYWVEENTDGCKDTASVSILFVEQPIADAGDYPDYLCNQEIELSANPSAGSGTWSIVSGPSSVNFIPSTSDFNTTAQFLGNGLYTIQWTENNGHGCVSSEQFVIDIIAPPFELNIISDTNNGCLPSKSFQFTVLNDTSKIESYLWQFNSGYTTNLAFPKVTFQTEGCVDVVLTAITDSGCVLKKTMPNIICMYPFTEPSFTYEPFDPNILNSELSFTNTTNEDSVSFVWFIKDILTFSDERDYEYFFPDIPKEYEVCLMTKNKYSCVDTTCKTINIKDKFFIYVPNTFTPNEDFKNEKFGPIISGALEEGYSFEIFDRWGTRIFQTDEFNEFWDGKIGGVEAKTGTYTWKVVVYSKVKKESEKVYFGHVNLVR